MKMGLFLPSLDRQARKVNQTDDLITNNKMFDFIRPLISFALRTEFKSEWQGGRGEGREGGMNKPLQHFLSLSCLTTYYRMQAKKAQTFGSLLAFCFLSFRSESGKDGEGRRRKSGEDTISHHITCSGSQPRAHTQHSQAPQANHSNCTMPCPGLQRQETRASSQAHSAWNRTRFSRPSFA